MSKTTIEIWQVLPNFLHYLFSKQNKTSETQIEFTNQSNKQLKKLINWVNSEIASNWNKSIYTKDETFGVIRWHPRRSGGSVMVFWAHLGPEELAIEARSVAGFAGVKTDLTRRGTTPENKIVELCIAFSVPLSPIITTTMANKIPPPTPNQNLPIGPFTFTIITIHFSHFTLLLGLRIFV